MGKLVLSVIAVWVVVVLKKLRSSIARDRSKAVGLATVSLKTLFWTCCLLLRFTVRTKVCVVRFVELMAWSSKSEAGVACRSATDVWVAVAWTVKRRVLGGSGCCIKDD